MPYIQFKDQQFPLGPGELTVGAFDGASARLPGDDPKARAVLSLGADGTALISRGSDDAVVLVNGVRLDAQPSPLLHGDRVELGGHELRFGADEELPTKPTAPAPQSDAVRTRMPAARAPSAATGGRLISLVDGREYAIPSAGLMLGREVGCDVVIASVDVSRRHAQIVPANDGYVLTDLSTNGVFVDGARVDMQQALERGDVLRIGPEEFRFHADAVGAPSGGPPAGVVSAPSLSNTGYMPARTPVPPRPPTPVEPPVAAPVAASVAAPIASAAPPLPPLQEAPTMPAPIVRAPSGADRRSLASLEITNEGPTKGRRFEIFTLLTNIGRGGHNDVVINDESLSVSHAKILRRDGAWWIVDQGSTNGTYVGGKRVQRETPLVGAPDVRFGNIKMIFRAAPSQQDDEAKGTRAIASLHVDAARKLTEELKDAATEPVAKEKKGCAAMVAFLVALGAAGATALVMFFTSRG